MSKIQAHVLISGKVQGVYFRVETQKQALKLGGTGWIRNLPDGKVEGIFEGSKEIVEKLIDWCGKGPSGAHVTSVQIEWRDYRGEFSSFGITY